MDSIRAGDADGFKIPSTIPQDLLLIHDLVGGDLPQASPSSHTQAADTNDSSVTRTSNSEERDTDSIASSSCEDSSDEEGDVDMLKADVIMKEEEAGKGADSEEEVEAGLLGGGEGGDPMTM
jgi:H/ACA ribonucleoprotein complex non-core subunit NAF1